MAFANFPVVDKDGAHSAIILWPVETVGPSLELAAWSWARLLSSITTNQSPSFLLNGSLIQVDLFAQAAQPIRPPNLDAVSNLSALATKPTAVVVGTDPSVLHTSSFSLAPSLTWVVDPTTRTSTLYSSTNMDLAAVQQLGSRLTHIVEEQTRSDSQLEISISKVPAMSVINPSPCILPGPQLLHNLALSGSYDSGHSKNAIEFLTAEGKIRCLSYHSLDQLSSKLATQIAHAAAARADGKQKLVVPVLLPQSMELYITWLAILKAGGAFCPLNIDAPPERIEFILQDVAASVVVTYGALVAQVPQGAPVTVINTDGIEAGQADDADFTPPVIDTTPSDLAYVMYTSGSTGRPKGVGISHLAATQSLLAHDELIPPFNRFLQFASPTFDVSVFEVFFPFMRGVTLIGSERENMLLDISHVMTVMKVDAAELTPTVAGELLRTRAAAPSLRVLLTIGEMLTKHVVEEFGQSESSDGILHGMYGPTEAAIHCTAATGFLSDARVNLIGKPFKTVSAFIMPLESEDKSNHSNLQALPMGEIGELVIGGPQLADGYINRPEENAKAFIDSPWYGRLYRTGDKARMLPSGEIECFGRISSGQVKLRGQRIELGEIEHVILRAPEVRSAVVIVGGGSLAAFVLVNDKGLTDRELRDICRQWLPRFMVPGEFILVDQFPQLPSGKIDRKALEADFARRRATEHSTDQQTFRDELEETISSCVTDVLGRQLKSTESLVASGLDSLAAIRLASHLLDAGIRLDVAHLLDADSIDGIWQLTKELEAIKPTEDSQDGLYRVQQLVASAGAARIESLGFGSQVIDIQPSTHIQQAMILETVRHAKAYCNWIELEFQSTVNSASVQDAFLKLLDQNPLLRCGFVEIGLKDHSFARFTWKAFNEQLIQKRSVFDYDLSLITEHDLLYPLRIQFKETENKLQALIHIHHALYDGWSWQLILNDLGRILLGQDIPSRPTYNIVSDFFIEHKLSEKNTESTLFWRDQLQGLSATTFPNFHGKTDLAPGTREATRVLNVSVPKLNDVSQRLLIGRQTIFQAAFTSILSSYLGSSDVVFGTVFSGRTLPVKGIEAVIGPCIRTLPTRMNLEKMKNVSDLLLAIQNMNRRSLEHGSLPLQEIKKASGIPFHQSLFDTALVWQENVWENDTQGALFSEVDTAEFLEFALLLEFEPRGDKIHAKATYQNSIFPPEQARILLEQIDFAASILIDSPTLAIDQVYKHLPLSTLSILNPNPETERNRSSLVTGVETIAFVYPNRTAIEILPSTDQEPISSDLQSITYGQLNAQANRLANYLVQQGLTRDSLAAIYLVKSINFYVCTLAVAKIGAGLLPLNDRKFLKTINSIRATSGVQPCVLRPSKSPNEESASLHSVSQIFLPDSLDNYPDGNLLMTHDSFYIVCFKERLAGNESADLAYLSHHNLQSHINVLADRYPSTAGSKFLQASSQPNASIIEPFFAWHMGITLCIASDKDLAKLSCSIINQMNITHLHLTPTLASRIIPKEVPSVRFLLTSGEPLTAKGRIFAETDDEPRGCFFEHPKFGRFYRSGDHGRLLPDGSILVIPQRGQTVLSNQSIVFEEIDSAMNSLDVVEDAVSMIFRSPLTNQQQLITTWSPSEHVKELPDSGNLALITKDIFEALSKKLPMAAVPSLLVPMDKLPMTESYKTDYSKIEEEIKAMSPERLGTFSRNGVDDSDADFTDNEKAIAAALSAVIGVDQRSIGRNTSFYKLGLDSLSAIAFSRKLQDLGYERIAVSKILRHSSVAQLVTVLPGMTNGHRPSLPSLQNDTTFTFNDNFIVEIKNDFQNENASVQSIHPCTPLQEAMLAAESDTNPAYFNHILLRVNTDLKDLESAWNLMLHRHNILRTCFIPTNDKVYAFAQVVLDNAALPWFYIETSSHELTEEIVKRKSVFELQSPINGKLPYSLTIFTDSSTHDNHLLLSIHHALYDGEAIGQLLQEIQLALAGQVLPKTTPFHTFIEYMVSASPNGSHEFWDRYLAGVAPTLLPIAERNQELIDSSASEQIYLNLSTSLDTFKQECKELSVAPLNVFHTAWARLLALCSGSSDVCFGNVFGCRTIPLDDVESIIGPCFNTLPMRVKLSPTSTNANVMRLFQEHNNDIMPHQLDSLRTIQKRTLGGGSQLFNTLVILQQSKTELDPCYWELLQDEGNMGFPLICEIVPDDKQNNISVCLHFNTAFLTANVATSLAQGFLALVEHTVQFPSAQASDKGSIGASIAQIFETRQDWKEVRKHTSFQSSSKKTQMTRPWSAQEETLRIIVCDFAGIDKEVVTLHTTIFQLGLDSIHAVQISGKLRKLGYKISAGDILEAASIGEIASLFETNQEKSPEEEFNFLSFENQYLPSVREQLGNYSHAVQALRPCTPVQNGMLALFTHSNGETYFNRMSLKFSRSMNNELLKRAWSKVMAQHEMLRTGFVQLPDQQYPFAMVTYKEDIQLPWNEATEDNAYKPEDQEQDILGNLFRPPWQITVEASDEVTTVRFSALHALYDAQSLEFIFSDVVKAYEGEALADTSSIESTLGPILMESQAQIQSAQKFWQGLASEVHSSKFPDLNPIRTDRKELLTSSICSSQSIKALEARCRDIGVTLQSAGQAAWARLLAGYTGEKNVTFGTVLSGRNLSIAAQNAVFPCLVTVPSPHRIEGSNRDLLDLTLKRNASLTKNQFTPLAQIQRWLGSDEPLFDTLFVYQKFSSDSTKSQCWDIIDEDTRIDYPLSIELVPFSTNLEIRVTYRNDLVPQEQAIVLLNQYDKLLEQTLFSPESSSDDYMFLGNQFLSITPAKEKILPTSVSLLHQFVEENAAKVPEKTAFEFAFGADLDNLQKKTWSYQQLNEDGNRIAHFLQSKGVAPGEMIAICFDKCPEASISILGILKAGCAYLAIDPSAPVSRKQFIMEDSNSKILLCNLPKREELKDLSGVEIYALDEPGVYQDHPCCSPILSREIQPNDTCYCLYTSGTTGTPKGCEITHDNAVQAMMAFQRLFSPHWDEESRWLQFASFHFDVSVLEQYWSWSVGICVTSCPRDLLFEDLPGTIQKLQITHIDLTPSLARLVHPDDVPSLCRGVFITGGEALKQEILDAWGHHGVIYNGYGPTEVTIGCTMLPRMRANDKPSNIGPQFDNVGSYVFRPGTSTPVLRGGLGELCVSGPLVGKGYLNRAELTKERFQDLPEYEDRVYRTGDLVRILFDGSFQFLGRIDDQIKLRGQRLEIGEINEVIKQATSKLNEVATLVVKHPKQSKDQLVSFVSKLGTDNKSRSVEIHTSDDNGSFLSTIKAACLAYLPGYMVPTHIIPLTRFPLSANNKADMKVLKGLYEELSLDQIQTLTAMAASQTVKSEGEEKIISVLSRFLGSTDLLISSWSSIYELGLDSISVISFSRTLRESGFPHAQPSLIMKNPTIAGMVSALQNHTTAPPSKENLYQNAKQAIQAFAHKHSHSILASIGIPGTDVQQIAPCTPLQEGIIYHFLSSDKPMYCSSFGFELKDSVNLDKLKASWEQAQSQVQMLRARFWPSPDGYAQVILRRDVLPWLHMEVASERIIENSRRHQVDHWISHLGNLSTGLWEVGIITSPEKSTMFLNIFHALYDGNSLGLLLELVAGIYNGHSKTSNNDPDFLDVLHLGPLCKDPSAESFWKEQLGKCEVRPLLNSEQIQEAAFVQSQRIDSTDHLDYLRNSLNVTEQGILHACWLLTLHRHFGFVPPIGIIASGRTIDIPGIENVIGPLFNTIPSNVQLRGLRSWTEVAQRCHEYHVSTMPFQSTALREIVKWLGRNPDEPLFDSLFVFQREDADESSTRNLWSPNASEAEHDYPLAFEIVRNNNKCLTITIAAKSHAVSPKTAQELLSSFEDVLSEFARNPKHEMPYLNGVSEEPQAQLNRISSVQENSNHLTESSFQWTTQACKIRDAIVSLSGVDVASVRGETSIFEVGLDSIDAIKLSSRLSNVGIKLPVSMIMRSRTIKAMTSQLTAPAHQEQNGTYPLLCQSERSLTDFLGKESLLPQGVCRVLPATPIQEAMVAEMTASGYQHYYNHEVLKLEPHVDCAKLREAWKIVVKTHPILRTSFVEVSDPEIPNAFAQVIHSEDTFDFQTVHLNGSRVDSIIDVQRRRAAGELANFPLLTVTVAIDGDGYYVILSIAHALYDGWSINLLHEDVARSYSGEDCTRSSPDAILEQIIASSGEQALQFWRSALSNYTPAPFPTGAHSESTSIDVHRAERPMSISSEQADAFCRREGITMQALLVSCWSLILATHTKKLDVVFGLVLSGRNVANSEDVMFPSMNTVAMRVILHGTRLDLVKYVQETLLNISEYQDFPLRRVRPDSMSSPLFDTLFIYQKRPSESENAGQVLYRSTEAGSSSVEYPVCAEIESLGESLVGRVACRGNLLGEEDTLSLLEHMEHVLFSIVNQSAQQTVDFRGEVMEICGYQFSQELSVPAAEPRLLSQMPGPREWSPIESKIRSVLAVVSGVSEETIDPEANIFQLGLDSISAIKVAALLKKQYVKLSVSDMLKAGTIKKMAAAVEDTNQTDLTMTDVERALDESVRGINITPLLQSYGIDLDQVQRTIPATAGQTYFLAMHSLNPSVFYPEFSYLATRQVSQEVLENAWSCLIDQTPILRTAFVPTDDSRVPYLQVVFKSARIPVLWHEAFDHQLVIISSDQEFGSIPVALHACQTSKGTAVILKIHHALYDAISLPCMMNELTQACNNMRAQLKFDTRDIAQLVAVQHVHSPVGVRRLFWSKYLDQIAMRAIDMPPLGEFGAIQQHYRPGLVSSMSQVEKAAKLRGLSIQSIFLAVYARLHFQIFGDSEGLVVGLYLANRSFVTEGLSELVAPTVNIVPLRLDNKIHSGGDSLFTAARKIQDDIHLISMIEHSCVSLVEIAEWTGVRINTCINFLRLPEVEESAGTATNQTVFKSIPFRGVKDENEISLDKTDPLLTNGGITAPASTQVMRAAVSTAAMGDVFLPTMDVEAAIREDRLDFGVFAPDARLGHDVAIQMIERMQQDMNALVEYSQ
ncbi:hypothetical protein N7466_009925 [Penicillium verhagenii]|uniref:uncharacterized protein n=1 Tax=Penicillium verhagenii TaxID=1562060 RepID=UPI0025453D62|nr:uncharacterized protein N7466_009925 [Penicillium verhagenii]KAJ5918982.1 hypothetical protein N7466_009925 [Penicillium verhagenii]